MSKSPNVIIVYYWGCFLDGNTGAHRRVLEQVDYLTRTTAEVIVYSYGSEDSAGEDCWSREAIARFAQRYPNARLELDTPHPALRWRTSIKNRLLGLFPGAAKAILAMSAKGRTPRFDALKQTHPDATFIVNYSDGPAQLNGVAAERVVVETHDLQYVKWRKLRGKRSTDLLTLLRMRQELAVLNVVSGVIAITRRDANVLETLLDSANVFSLPAYGADLPEPAVCEPLAQFRHDLLFVASDNAFNVTGMCRFLDKNKDWLNAYRIAICGRICRDREIQECAAKIGTVELLGFVEDLGPVYAGAKACLSPIDGTGLKIKVVEALRHRKPVFASAHSMEGLAEGFEACVFPIERSAIESLLREDKIRQAAEAAATAYVWRFAATSEVGRLATFLDLEMRAETSVERPALAAPSALRMR